MNPVLPNGGAEQVSTCPTTACSESSPQQTRVGLSVTSGGIDPLKTPFSPCAGHACKWRRRPSSCAVTKGGSPPPSLLPEQGPAEDGL